MDFIKKSITKWNVEHDEEQLNWLKNYSKLLLKIFNEKEKKKQNGITVGIVRINRSVDKSPGRWEGMK